MPPIRNHFNTTENYVHTTIFRFALYHEWYTRTKSARISRSVSKRCKNAACMGIATIWRKCMQTNTTEDYANHTTTCLMSWQWRVAMMPWRTSATPLGRPKEESRKLIRYTCTEEMFFHHLFRNSKGSFPMVILTIFPTTFSVSLFKLVELTLAQAASHGDCITACGLCPP